MILVDVYVPSLDAVYDFMLDENVEIYKIILEISEMIVKKVKNKNEQVDKEFLLYWVDKKMKLDRRKTLHSCGIIDGCRLMLV